MRFWAGLAALAVVGGICTALVGEDAKTGGKSEEKKDGSLLSKIRRNHQVDSSADRLNNSFRAANNIARRKNTVTRSFSERICYKQTFFINFQACRC